MHIHFIIHEHFEGPGAYLTWARLNNHKITMTKLYEGETLPTAIDSIDLLIVLGGPQHPRTTTIDCPYFDAQAETQLIRQCVDQGKAVIGVCLGAQLIGEALGQQFSHSPEKEIGVWPITLSPYEKENNKFKHFKDKLAVGHWHNDMPGITTDAKIIAHSEGCPRQIVEYTNLVYGFQCHMEFTPELIELLITNDRDNIVKNRDKRFIQSPEQLRVQNYTQMNEALYTFLDQLAIDYLHSLNLK